MRRELKTVNKINEKGMPAGGYVEGVGIAIRWQDGPVMPPEGTGEPNGAFVEDVIQAAVNRFVWFQSVAGGRFACKENEGCIDYLLAALSICDARRVWRQNRGVDGTHDV